MPAKPVGNFTSLNKAASPPTTNTSDSSNTSSEIPKQSVLKENSSSDNDSPNDGKMYKPVFPLPFKFPKGNIGPMFGETLSVSMEALQKKKACLFYLFSFSFVKTCIFFICRRNS
jgi:hypothetical protein